MGVLKAVLAEPRSKAEVLAKEEARKKLEAAARHAEGRQLGEEMPEVYTCVKDNSCARINNSTPERVPTVPGRVSVICPTIESRHDRHPQLYGCFLSQFVRDKELIVIDTGPSPSYFFKCLSDIRVRYVHIEGPEDSMTVGAKRNRALNLASGEFVAHFDDDDLYAPP